MRTLQTKGRSKNKTMVNRIGKIGLLAFLFIFVFSMVCIVLDTNISSSIQNGTFDNVAKAYTAPVPSGHQYYVTGNDHKGTLGTISSANSDTITATKRSSFTDYASNNSADGTGYYGQSWNDATRKLIMYETYKISDENIVRAINYGLVSFSLAITVKAGTENVVRDCTINSSCFVDVGTSSDSAAVDNNGSWTSVSSSYCDASVSKGNNNYSSRNYSISAFTPNSSSANNKSTYYVRVGMSGNFVVNWGVGSPKVQYSIESYTLTLKLTSTTINFVKSPTDKGSISSDSASITKFNQSVSSTASTIADGYHFTGWSGGNGTLSVSDGTLSVSLKNITSKTSTTFTASFAKNTATLKYNNNSGSGTISNSTITYETDFTLNGGSSFSRTNYTLIGWSTNSGDNLKEFSLNQSITDDKIVGTNATNKVDLLSSHGGEVTLYAVWASSDFGGTKNSTWGSESNPFLIENIKHLQNLSMIVSGAMDPVDSVQGSYYGNPITSSTTTATSTTYSGCFFKVTASDITGYTLIIGSNSKVFSGTFDGNGKTIGLNIDHGSTAYTGLFGYTSGGAIKNVTVSGTVKGGQYTAGIVGYANGTAITSCNNSATITGAGQTAGIVGQGTATSSISGTVTNTGKITGNGMVGGIGGQYHGTFGSSATITNGSSGNINHATIGYISGTGASVGGVFAFFDKNSTSATLINYGQVHGSTACGGIVGRTQNAISGAKNYGNVTSSGGTYGSEVPSGQSLSAVGGITGYTNNNISNSLNEGTISATSNGRGVGGITGTYYNGTNPQITNCYNKGSVSGTDYVGGIAGYWDQPISYTYNEGAISGTTSGGIAGKLVSGKKLLHCYNKTASYLAVVGNGSTSSDTKAVSIYVMSSGNPSAQTGGNYWKYAAYPSGVTITPTANGSSKTWEGIVSNHIDGYVVAGLSCANNHYYSITQNNLSSQPSSNTVAISSTVLKSDVVYSTDSLSLTLTCNYNSANIESDIVVRYLDLTFTALNPYYDTTAHNITAFTSATSPTYINEFKYYTSSNTLTTNCINAGTYRVIGYPFVGTSLVGISNNSSGCVIKKLPITYFKLAFDSSYASYSSPKETISGDVYATPLRFNSAPYSIYRADDSKFHFFFQNLNESGNPVDTSLELSMSSDGVGTDLMRSISGNSGSDNIKTLTAVFTPGNNANIEGSATFYYAWATYDYSGRPGSGSKVWGNSSNPYIINNVYELVRLYDICTSNDTSWGSINHDSVYNDDIAKCTVKTYAGGIFYINNDIDVSGYPGFRIGKSSTYFFAGSIYGKNGSTDTARTITLNTTLPNGYHPVEYIEFSGAQYIDSGVTSLTASNFSVTIDFQRTNIDDADSCLFGQRQFGKFTNIYAKYFESAYGNTSAGTANNYDRTVLLMNQSGLYKNGSSLKTGTISSISSSYSALIGAFSEDSGANAKWLYKGRIFSLKIVDNGTCIRYFVPCVRESDSVAGLYDQVNGVFYENSGSGSLIAGDAIASGSDNVGLFGYYKASGTCAISNINIAGYVSGKQYTGGLIGYCPAQASGNTTDIINISNVTNSAKISGYTHVGGLMGRLSNTNGSLQGTITNLGEVYGSSSYVGGICGYHNGKVASGTVITNGSSDNINHTTIGYVHGAGSYTAGCFGVKYSQTLENVSSINNYGKVDGKAATGGIVGRCSVKISNANNYGNVTSSGGSITVNKGAIREGTTVGGIVAIGQNTISNCTNYGVIQGASIVGGIAGTFYYYNIEGSTSNNTTVAPTITNCKNRNNVTATATNSYVGGIAGIWRGNVTSSSNNDENGSSITITGRSYVGGYFGMYLHYDGKSATGLENIASVTGNGSYVGGIVGYNEGKITGDVSNNKLVNGNASNGNYVGGFIGANVGGTLTEITKYTISGGVTGKNYVGGYIGASKGSEIRIGTNSTLSGIITATDGSYAGGAFGYIFATGSKTTSIARSNEGSYFRFTPSTMQASLVHPNTTGSYVGGIVGYCAGISIENGENSTFNAWTRSSNLAGDLAGEFFVGGAVGYMTTFPKISEIVKTYDNPVSGLGGATAVSAGNTVNPGYLYSISYNLTIEGESVSYTKYFIPTIYGKVSRSGDVITITDNNEFITSGDAMTYVSTSISGWYKNTATITGTSFVGGIVGKIDTGVGNYVVTASARGATGSKYIIGVEAVDDAPISQDLVIKFQNEGSVTGTYFVGGTIGALLNNYNSSTVQYTSNIKAVVSNNATVSANDYGWYIGGIIGSVGTYLDADRQDSYGSIQINGLVKFNENDNEGSFAGNNSTEKIIGDNDGSNDWHNKYLYYVGGVAGFMNANGDNRIAYFVNSFKVQGHYFVGGLVGCMAGGANEANGSSIYRCISTPHAAASVDVNTNYYNGYYYVGGLIGDAGAVTISNGYVRGYLFANVDGDRGGVVGRSTSSTTIIDSWAILYVDSDSADSDLSYKTIYNNSNGKFILIDPDYARMPSYNEILVTAGLLNSVGSGNEYASHSSFASGTGYISIRATIPNSTGQYLVFYNTNGSQETNPNRYIHSGTDDTLFDGILYGGKGGEPSNELYSKTKASANSFIFAKAEAKFVNLEYSQTNVNNIPTSNWVAAFNNGRISNEYTIDSISYTYSGGTFTVSGTVFYNNLSTGSSEDKWKVGSITKSLTEGSDDMPISIPDKTTWITYANNVRNGTNYLNKTLKLLNDIDLGTYSSSNNFLFGTTSNVFRGTLDGNGKTLKYTISGSDNVGLFPSIGQSATIKNIYLSGTVTGSGNSVGALIGTLPNTGITIQNVDTAVNVTGTYHVGGLIGYANGSVTIKDAVNTGTVRETSTNANGGVGGIIGTVAQSKTASIDSVRNAGEVRGDKSMGGIIGYVYGSAEIMNSCNTGLVQSINYAKDVYTYAGGICGQVSTNGNVNVYACYNSGKVWGYNARVGGILGCDTDSRTSSSGRTKVFYSFNSGNVLSGHPAHCDEVYGGNNTFQYYNGGEVGGLVGMAINADIYYCYNIGEVTTFGCTSHLYESQLRAGGLVGMMYRYHDDSYSSLAYCYNAGLVKARCPVDNAIYISGLVGCSIYERSGWWILDVLKYWSGANNLHSSATVAHNFSLHGQVDLGQLNGSQGTETMTRGSKYSDEDGYFGVDRPLKFMESHRNSSNFLYMDFAFYAANWTLQDTVITAEQMVGRYDSSNGIGMVPSGMSSEWSNGGNYGSTVLLRTPNAIKSNSNFGYIYLPGCLPQLSIFATDTESGVAMTGQTSGYDTTTQQYDLKTAGTEFSPYVIQNGIDLLGLSQLIAIDTSYTASGKYYAFANGYNNLDGNKLTTLNMNTLNLYDMKYYSQGGYRPGVNNKSIMGYTYGIASESGSTDYGIQTWYSANYNDSRNVGKNIRLFRRQNNNYLDGNSSYNSNFYQIGPSSSKSFQGSLVGFREVVNGEEISYPELQNLHIVNTKAYTDSNESSTSTYAAFVGYGSNCILRDFSIGTGSTITVSTSSISASNAIASGFVAKAMNKTTLTGLQMHSGASITINKTTSGSSYAGGIAGYARPNMTSATGANLTTIEECSSTADITTSSSATPNAYVGGILGYAHGLSTYATAGIYINKCDVVGGTITNGSNKGTGIGVGGIVGGRNEVGKLNITECTVGASSTTTTIKGANAIGGIISATNGTAEADLTTIRDCEIGDYAVLQRTSSTNSSLYGNGSAIGGFVGYSSRCLIAGENIFKGSIITGSYVSKYLGGLLGYMGSYTNIQGTVHIYGSINTGSTASSHIGGAIGYVPAAGVVNIDGNYYINPQMTTSSALYVGGFIGYNAGTAHILGSSNIMDIQGDTSGSSGNSQAADDTTTAKTTAVTANTISADTHVGGFIGYNTGTLYVGHQTDAYNTASVGTFTATLVANVNGTSYVGGFVGYNEGVITTVDSKCYVVNTGNICIDVNNAQYIGGIVGYNAEGAYFNVAVQENYFANAGQVGNSGAQNIRASYAGGVVGDTLGNFTNIGTLANTGAVYGNNYVGGSIGYFPDGALAGTMINGKAKEDTYGNLVSNSSKTISGATTTYITQVSTTGDAATATDISLYRSVTKDANYSYSIGKTMYYFTAPISGNVVEMDIDKVAIVGNISASANSDVITNTSNIWTLNDNTANIINTSTTYKYTLSTNEYYYPSAYYGAVYNISADDPDLITIYPTLRASTTAQSGASYTTQPVGNMTKGYKTYSSGSTYYFDASNLTGTVKELQGANVVFSTLKVSAVRNAMQGTMTANLGDILNIDQNYTFLVGTTRYFFKSPVYGQITNMVGNELTISPFTMRTIQKIVQGNTVKGNHNYLYESGGNYYRFTSPVTGTATSISGATTTLKFVVEGKRSAIPSVTANWNLGGHVKAGVRYRFKIGESTYRYFVAPYSGDITQIFLDNSQYYVRITNTDYSDMVVDDTITSSGYTAGYVNGYNNVGGVVAIVEASASVDFYTEGGNLVEGVYTRFINFGTVASTDGTNVGGSIGTMKGSIYDTSDEVGKTLNEEQQYIEFYNYGKVYVKQNGGGSIGVFSGQGAWARMFNYSDTTIMGAEINGTITSYANIGGCIGLVQSEGGNPVILKHSIMVNSGLVSAQTNRLTVGSTNVTGECIGGVIGKIADGAVGSTKNNWSVDLYSDGSVTAGRTTNDSANYAPMNYVGGLIGYIGSTPVILKSVLNYTKRSGGTGTGSGSNVTYVSGHHYVGGIVGFNNSTVTGSTDEEKASIKYCYNVGGRVISDDYTFTDSYNTSGTCGGIVGGIGSNRPLTYCCYWISAFGNDALKNATVSQLGTSLTSEWTSHFTAYDISLLQYSPTSWADYLHIYDSFYYAMHSNTLPYDYYSYNEETETWVLVGKRGYADIILDTSNTYSAAEIAECTDWFNTHVLDVEFGQGIYEYGGEDIAPISAQAYDEAGYAVLQQCVATRKGFNIADLEENTDGDLGIHIGGDTRYSTGNDNTGYFFAYASDAVTGGFSNHEIQTEHTNNAATPDFDLNVWKYISQAFGASNVGQSSSQLIYNYTATDDSYDESSIPHHTNSTKAIGNTQIYHIYAKTYAPEVNGYYLYAYAVNKEGFTVAYDVYDGGIYIDADSAVCKNVLVFFKKVNLGAVKLTYNSLERYAPITGLTNVEKKDQQYTYYKLNPNAAEGFNFGTDAGTYKIDGDIYYVPNKAYLFTASSTVLSNTTAITAANKEVVAGNNYTYKVGSTDYYFTALVDGWIPEMPTTSSYEILAPIKVGTVRSGETTYTWKISPRKLVINNTNTTETYDKTEKSGTLVITQIVGTDVTDGTYTWSNITNNGVYPELTATPSIANPYPAFSGVVASASTVTSSTGASTKDGGYCTSTTSYQLKTYTLYITAVNAGSYKLRATSIKGSRKDNYQLAAKETELKINKKELTATWHTDSYTWDGTEHSFTLDLTGWAVGESTNDIKTWTDAITFNMDTENSSPSGNYKRGSAATVPSGSTSVAATKATVAFSATAKNKYTVDWTSGAAVGTNYLMPDNEQGEMTIATLKIIQRGSPSSFGSVTYDGSEHTVSISLKSVNAQNQDLSLTAATISTIYDAIKTRTKIDKSGIGPTGTGVATSITYSNKQTSAGVFNMTITYHLKNAGNYTCKINNIGSATDDYYLSTQTVNNQIIYQKSLTVTPTGETTQYSTSSPGPETVFDNVNIGLTKVEVNGFVSSDASSYTNVINTTASGFTPVGSGSGSKVTYTIATKNVGNYSITVSPMVNTNYTFTEASWYWRIKTRTITATATWSEVDTSNNETTTSESLSGSASTKNYTYSTYPQGLKSIVFSGLAQNHTAQNIVSTTPSSNIIANVAGNNLTVKEKDQSYTGTDDAGTYTLNIGYNSDDENYTIDFKTRWVIAPVSIKAKSNITTNTEAYYNGQNHDVTISYQIGESTLSGNVYGQDTISGSNAQIISGGSATTNVCNVGVYTLTIASSVGSGGITASRGGSTDKSANYVLDTTGFSSNVTYTVLPLKIDFVWSETNTFVYNGQTHKVALDGIKLYAGDECVSGENPVAPKTTPVDVISGTTTTTYSFVGRTANETLTIVVVSDESVNYLASGIYAAQANYSAFRVSGTNTVGIDTIIENYEYKSNNSTTFSIYKSIISISSFTTLATITKTYDGTTTIDAAHLNNNPVKDNYATATFVSTNGGANTPTYSISNPRYNDPDVGTGKIINYTVSVADTNYTFATVQQSGTNGIITPRVLNVDLYLKNNKTATKQYDDTELYGTATNVNGQTSARSASYRLGKGFTVSNIISSETSGHVIVTGMYRETTASRRVANGQTGEPSYNKYVNNVVYNAGTYSINKNAGYYKELVFIISGEKAGNYLLQVTTPAVSGDPAAEVVVKDTHTFETSPGYELNIEITRTQIKIDNYGNTVQSYAQTNNVYTYQTEEGWLPVTAEKPARVSNLLNITIDNTWMYEGGNPANGWAHITAYKRIVGGPGKQLYAYLTGSQGMNMNYELKNQPTLVIDYFVVEDTEHYQISTLAGLMLASYYYNNYATIGEESGSDASVIYTWTVICTEEQYNANPESYQEAIEEHDGYFDPEAPYPGDATKTGVWGYWAETPTDPIKYDKFRLMADISGIMTSSDYDILKNAFGVSPTTGNPIWGFGNTYLTNFVQTKVGNQVTVIGNIFADTFVGEFDGNGYVIKNFNVLYNVAIEEATTINVGFFGYATNTANIYDMNLRDISINVYDSTSYANVINVGGLIGLSDMAKALTDTTIHANISVYASGTNKVVNVGGVVGFYVGTISDPDAVATKYNIASAPFTFPTEYDVNVAIENAIAVGSITVNNAGKNNLGGVVGVMRGGDGGASVFSPVTLNEIQSRAGTTLAGGIIGYVNPTYTFSAGKITSFTQNVTDLAVENETKYILGAGVAQYLQDSILVWTDATTSTFVNKMIGNVTTTGSTSTDAGRKATGLTYTELAYNGIEGGYRRSQSHYINTSSNYIYLPENTVTRGIYDVISETTSGGTAKYTSYIINTGNAYTSNNPRESLRFVDIVYTYLLRLELVTMSQQITIESTNVNVRVYKQLQESPILGTRRGTDHIDANSQYTDRILMAYSQHYPLLRMFRFASFELTKQINLYTNNYNIVYSGAFYGHVYSDKVQVISSNAGSYTTRKVGTKTYTTLDAYVAAYQKFYGLTLEIVGGYYVYKDPAKINVGIMIQGKTETMFEVEKNTIPYTRSELKTGG